MNKTSVKFLSVGLLFAVVLNTSDVNAQKKGKAAPKKAASANPFGGATSQPATPAPSSNPFGGGGTTQPPAGGANPFGGGASSTTSSANPFGGGASAQPPANKTATGGNVPINVVKSTNSNDPLNDSNRPSLRNESAIISNVKDRMPLPYDDIREDDAIYRHKIWKIIDAREKLNAPFKYEATEDNGSQLFFSILYRAITEDSVVAFEDERFTQPYKDITKFKEKFSGGVDTSDQFDLDNNLIGREVRTKEFPIDSIYSFQIKEEVIFDKEAARLVHRIVGIAPMGPLIVKGKVYPGPHFPYFWIYYPDVRKTLAKKQVYNAKNVGARMTWEDYLENHMFSYYIIKSSMDNVKNQKLKDYIKDPMFVLFEGDKIRDKIFNYEQGLWAY